MNNTVNMNVMNCVPNVKTEKSTPKIKNNSENKFDDVLNNKLTNTLEEDEVEEIDDSEEKSPNENELLLDLLYFLSNLSQDNSQNIIENIEENPEQISQIADLFSNIKENKNKIISVFESIVNVQKNQNGKAENQPLQTLNGKENFSEFAEIIEIFDNLNMENIKSNDIIPILNNIQNVLSKGNLQSVNNSTNTTEKLPNIINGLIEKLENIKSKENLQVNLNVEIKTSLNDILKEKNIFANASSYRPQITDISKEILLSNNQNIAETDKNTNLTIENKNSIDTEKTEIKTENLNLLGVSEEIAVNNDVIDVKNETVAEVFTPKQAAEIAKADIPKQILNSMDNLNITGDREYTINLEPEYLGKLTIKMVVENNKLSIEFVAGNQKAQLAVQENLADLQKALKAQNFEVDRINVSYDTFNNSNNGNGSFSNNEFLQNFSGNNNSQNHNQNHKTPANLNSENMEEVISKSDDMLKLKQMSLLNYKI